MGARTSLRGQLIREDQIADWTQQVVGWRESDGPAVGCQEDGSDNLGCVSELHIITWSRMAFGALIIAWKRTV